MKWLTDRLAFWRGHCCELRADALERRAERLLERAGVFRARAAKTFQRLGLSE